MRILWAKRGEAVYLSDEDYLNVSRFNWFVANTTGGKRYVVRTCNKRLVYLHRLIMGASKGQLIDHVNGDTLDNRRINLRICTHSDNMKNVKKCGTNRAKSKYKGVSKDKYTWRARITINGKTISLGAFKNEIMAAKEYDAAAVYLFGEFALLNFPG